MVNKERKVPHVGSRYTDMLSLLIRGKIKCVTKIIQITVPDISLSHQAS